MKKRGERSQPWRLHPMPRQGVTGTENWRAVRHRAKAIENLGFRADPDRILLNAKPLTTGHLEFRSWRFGSPNATLFITKTENSRELTRRWPPRLADVPPGRPRVPIPYSDGASVLLSGTY
jgi:hypothetical protein